jgi:drug/metabolite transporter (DMT)-like permease
MGLRLFLLILGHLAISSLTHVLARGVLVYEGLPPTVVVASRSAIAALVLLPLGRVAGRPTAPWTAADTRRLLLVAALAVPANQLLYITGLKYTHAVHGALLFCLTPLFVGALTAVLEGVRTPRGAWLGTVVALGGVAIVTGRGFLDAAGRRDGSDLLKGDLILLGAVVAWSFVTVLSRPLLTKLPSFAVSRRILLVGAALLFPFVLPDVVAFPWPTLTPRAAGVLVFFGVATSVVAYVLWTMLLRRLGAVGCAVLINLQPLAVGLLASAMLDEPATPELFAGGLLIVAGVLWAQRAVARAHAERLLAAADDPPLAG